MKIEIDDEEIFYLNEALTEIGSCVSEIEYWLPKLWECINEAEKLLKIFHERVDEKMSKL
ncbi:MAG: hypothetical protein DRI44_02545 [Chlamydiae bacterium]|nr:MAG: hypothetical protein DRI44_02545 [Chlamydiota bacterium]